MDFIPKLIKRSINDVKDTKSQKPIVQNDKYYFDKTVAALEEELASYKKYVELLKKQNEDLINENNLLKEKCNRHAGRKKRGTPSEINRIMELYDKHTSLGNIAKIMTAETNTSWSKSTIKSIVDRTKILMNDVVS